MNDINLQKKSNNYKSELIILFCMSIIMMFFFNKQIRDYIPILFLLIGFMRFAYLTWKKFYELSDILINNYKDLLNDNGIQFKKFGGMNKVDFFDLITQREKLIEKEQSLKFDITEFITLKNITIISFLCFGILGLISVLMA